jgi:hypothetical protein
VDAKGELQALRVVDRGDGVRRQRDLVGVACHGGERQRSVADAGLQIGVSVRRPRQQGVDRRRDAPEGNRLQRIETGCPVPVDLDPKRGGRDQLVQARQIEGEETVVTLARQVPGQGIRIPGRMSAGTAVPAFVVRSDDHCQSNLPLPPVDHSKGSFERRPATQERGRSVTAD